MDTVPEELPTETISSRELELQQDLEHKKREIHKLNESIKNFQKILNEKDKNICFLMRTQEETIECHSKEKKELQEQIEKLQNDSWTNISPSPDLVSVFVQTDTPKNKDKEDFNKVCFLLKNLISNSKMEVSLKYFLNRPDFVFKLFKLKLFRFKIKFSL